VKGKNEAIVPYFGQCVKVNCDRRCAKAWGISQRPYIQLSQDENDIAYLADSELPNAPIAPGTWEGWDTKPLSPDDFPNKWCVRECERCNKSVPGKFAEPLKLKKWNKRVYNFAIRQKD
jgi:hypothetical protein